MSLNKTRAWVAGAVVVWILLSVAAWFLVIGPKRAEAAEVREQTLAVQQQNQQTEQRIETLKKQAADLPKLQAERDELRAALPQGDEIAALTRRLNAMADSSQAILDSIATGTPVEVSPAATPAPAAEEGTGEGEAATDTTATQAAAAPAASAGLVKVPITVTVTGTYNQSLDFLKRLQSDDGRNYLVESISVGDPKLLGDGNVDEAKAKGWVTMTIVGSVFALPETAAAAPAADTAATPGAGTAATPAAGGTENTAN